VTGWSFPSGHASQASAFWFALVLALRAAPIPRCELRLAWAAAIVTAVALSRVWLGVHYPSDVIAGLLLGGGWAVFVARCPGRASTRGLRGRRATGRA
jgi:undecaprenyl-diphosphatase